MAMPLTGRCQCGGAAYEISGTPLEIYVCHCLECRRQSASAFGISAIVRAAEFAVVRGNLKRWSRAADRGGTLDCTFCADCGSRLFHATPGEDVVSVKGGSLDVPPDLTAAAHIWTCRKMPGVLIPPGAPQFAQEPD
jgi:hypothetical protein